MKQLNYLPSEVRIKRVKGLVLKIALAMISLTLLYSALVFLQVSGLRGDVKTIKVKVETVQSLESDILKEKLKLQENTSILYSLGSNPIPLNRLLGTLLNKTPKDIVINDLYTTDYVPKAGARDVVPEILESEEQVQKEPSTPTNTASQAKQNNNVNANSLSNQTTTQQQQTAKESNTENSIIEQNNRIGVYSNPQSLILRGTSFDLQSISYLAYVLKNEDYVSDVQLSPIENYDDGNYSHKVFEMVIILGGSHE